MFSNENTLKNALDLAKQYINIPNVDLNITKHRRRSILYYNNKTCTNAATIITTIPISTIHLIRNMQSHRHIHHE